MGDEHFSECSFCGINWHFNWIFLFASAHDFGTVECGCAFAFCLQHFEMLFVHPEGYPVSRKILLNPLTPSSHSTVTTLFLTVFFKFQANILALQE